MPRAMISGAMVWLMAMRQGGEDQARAVQRRRLEPLDARIGISQRQMWMDVGQRRARLAVAEQAHRPQPRMTGTEPEQLRTDEPGGSKDGDVDHGPIICISMHNYAITNRGAAQKSAPECPGRLSFRKSGSRLTGWPGRRHPW